MTTCVINNTTPVAANNAGWHARLEMAFEPRNHKTVLTGNCHTGPLRVQRPFYPENDVCHAYVLHPPGGIVGGDRLEVFARVAPGASALITTPGATKFYRSDTSWATQESILHVASGGRLEWFPQETIFYPGAQAASTTRFELDEDAGLMAWEIMSIGLPACGEPFNGERLQATLHINRQGKPLLKDRLRITSSRDMAGPSGLRGRSVTGTFAATGCTDAMLAPLRELTDLAENMLTGATLLDDLLVVRALGDSSDQVKQLFGNLWAWLRPHLFGRPACPPRIWAT